VQQWSEPTKPFTALPIMGGISMASIKIAVIIASVILVFFSGLAADKVVKKTGNEKKVKD
jgi:ascorbate-specific PTS system EIIC-type component UlaA